MKYEMEGKKFNAGCKSVETSAAKLKLLTHGLAMAALANVNYHNNSDMLQRLFDVMGAGLARDGLVKWAAAFGKVKFEQGKFKFVNIKAITESPEAFLDKANDQPYWEFSAAHKPADAQPYDVAVEIAKIIKKAQNVHDGKVKSLSEVLHPEMLDNLKKILSSMSAVSEADDGGLELATSLNMEKAA